LSKVTLKVPSGPVRSSEPAKDDPSAGVTVWVPSRTFQVTVSPWLIWVTVPLAGVKQGGPQVLSHLAGSAVALISLPAAATRSAQAIPPAATTTTDSRTRITERPTDTCLPFGCGAMNTILRRQHRQQVLADFSL
jgi:hypothetical protein